MASTLSNTLEVKLELRCGNVVLFVLVVMLPSLFSITVIVCTLPPGVIIALESASGIPGKLLFECFGVFKRFFLRPRGSSLLAL